MAGMKRRTLISTAGWAVPAAIVASASPAVAVSSPCSPRTVRFTDDGWSPIIDRVGEHPYNYRQPNADAVAVTNGSWRSVADQIHRTDQAELTYLEYDLTTSIAVVAGTPVTLTIPLLVSWANGAPTTSLEQRLTVLAGDSELAKASTRPHPFNWDQYHPDNHDSAQVAASPHVRADGHQVLVQGTNSLTVTFTPSTTGEIDLTFRFWKALAPNLTRLSAETPFNAQRLENSGTDKLTVSPFTFDC